MTSAIPIAFAPEPAVNHYFVDAHPNVAWAAGRYYRGRAHLALAGSPVCLCGTPVGETTPFRPFGTITCPECAIAFVEATVGSTTGHANGGSW